MDAGCEATYDDEAILLCAGQALLAEWPLLGICILSRAGMVTLVGTVREAQTKRAVEEAVRRALAGAALAYRQVTNEIEVNDAAALPVAPSNEVTVPSV